MEILVSILERDVQNNDKIWHDNDSIVINGAKYNFKKQKDFHFKSPNEQIPRVHRDENGELNATIYKYVTNGYDIANTPMFEENIQVLKEIDVTEEKPLFTDEELIEQELSEINKEMDEIYEQTLKEIVHERLGVSND